MYLSNQGLMVIIVVAILAGYLSGKVVRGGGFGSADGDTVFSEGNLGRFSSFR